MDPWESFIKLDHTKGVLQHTFSTETNQVTSIAEFTICGKELSVPSYDAAEQQLRHYQSLASLLTAAAPYE